MRTVTCSCCETQDWQQWFISLSPPKIEIPFWLPAPMLVFIGDSAQLCFPTQHHPELPHLAAGDWPGQQLEPALQGRSGQLQEGISSLPKEESTTATKSSLVNTTALSGVWKEMNFRLPPNPNHSGFCDYIMESPNPIPEVETFGLIYAMFWESCRGRVNAGLWCCRPCTGQRWRRRAGGSAWVTSTTTWRMLWEPCMSGRLLLVRARGWYVVYPSYYCTSTMPTLPIPSGVSSLFFCLG